MHSKNINNFWISLSDIMTALMVLFMFIAISYIVQVKQEQKDKNYIIEHYRDTNQELYKDLHKEFEREFSETKWNAEITKDLSIQFLNENILFDYNKSEIKEDFKTILDEFFPRYASILLQPKYRDNISEIRIEGHTDSEGDYMYNMNLSQRRATEVLKYLLFQEISEFKMLAEEDRKYLKYWLTATGYSSGRTVDRDGKHIFTSNKTEDPVKSRRVEFRIITKSEEIIKKFLEQKGF